MKRGTHSLLVLVTASSFGLAACGKTTHQGIASPAANSRASAATTTLAANGSDTTTVPSVASTAAGESPFCNDFAGYVSAQRGYPNIVTDEGPNSSGAEELLAMENQEWAKAMAEAPDALKADFADPNARNANSPTQVAIYKWYVANCPQPNPGA